MNPKEQKIEDLAKALYDRRADRENEPRNPFSHKVEWSDFTADGFEQDPEAWRNLYRRVAKDALEILGLIR